MAAVWALVAASGRARPHDEGGLEELDALLLDALAAAGPQRWTTGQARAAWTMVARSRSELRSDVHLAAIAEPPVAGAVVTKDGRNRIEVDRGDFVVELGYLDPSVVIAVQRIPGAAFTADRTVVVPGDPAAVKPLLRFVRRHGIDFSETLVERVWEIAQESEARLEASRSVDADLMIDGLNGTLRPFQRAAVAYALRTKRTFIADQMGLGKTIEALATIQAAEAYPALVICPASVKLNWAREAHRWVPSRRVDALEGGSVPDEADITIINYDVLDRHVDVLTRRGFRALVLDESHYVKNGRAKRTKLCTRISQPIPLRLLLSGTPMLNRPQELVPQLRILGRLDDLGGYRHFMHRYCGASASRHERVSGDANEPRYLGELNDKLRETCYIRRTKDEVLVELPAKQRAIVPMSLDNRREYERVLRDVVAFVGEMAENDARRIAEAVERHRARTGDEPDEQEVSRIRREVRASAEARAERARQLVEIETLKRTAAKGKLENIVRWTADFLQSGEKLVIFGWHRDVVNALAERFGAPMITGDTPIGQRQAVVDRFQQDRHVRLVVCNVRAAGVGLTLTAASNVAFCELGWTPAEHDQAEDRCHRIGQSDSVNAWYLLAEDTIDAVIYDLIERKRAIIDAATEGVAPATEPSILLDLAARLQLAERSAGSH